MQEAMFALDLNAISPEQRPNHTETPVDWHQTNRPPELPNGYRFEFPAMPLVSLAQFVFLECLCCPFFDFIFQVGSSSDTIGLVLSGPEGVKAFIRAEFGELME